MARVVPAMAAEVMLLGRVSEESKLQSRLRFVGFLVHARSASVVGMGMRGREEGTWGASRTNVSVSAEVQ